MAFTFSIKDTYRQSVEAASGGRQTVLYDDKGIPSIMNIIPKLSYKDVGIGNSDSPLPAFIKGGVVLPEIFIGTYLANMHDGRAYSLPGQVPRTSITADAAIAAARAKGPGWHVMTNAEYAAIALWCKKNGFYPRGNNNYGSDHSAPHERCRPGTVGSDGRINLGLTGSGPSSWTHDGTPNGIYGLNGDAWEWAIGVRIMGGEIQILADNDAALDNADLTVGSAAWKAILEDGTLVAPGTANTLKFDATGTNGTGTPKINKVITSQGDGSASASSQFKDIAVESGITIPDILKALALFPTDTSDHGGDYFYTRNEGERFFYRGGYWRSTSHAGVFAAYGSDPRSHVGTALGFRVAFSV